MKIHLPIAILSFLILNLTQLHASIPNQTNNQKITLNDIQLKNNKNFMKSWHDANEKEKAQLLLEVWDAPIFQSDNYTYGEIDPLIDEISILWRKNYKLLTKQQANDYYTKFDTVLQIWLEKKRQAKDK